MVVVANVTAGATVADTEEIVGLVVSGLLVTVLVPPWRHLAFGVFGTEDQKLDIGSEGVGLELDLVKRQETNNKIAVASHSEVGLERVEAQVGPAAVVLLGGAEQEPIAGYVFHMHCQMF